ncbi:MAG: xylulose 5-phosphate 3-epimerase [Pseudohongiella sp.]|nr:xylulose 5-phosphate 3-epimerase [Pseudohongiella sp.]MDO9518858.1 xylulose 5-phosphate 3-epimerase [Pseudohongiella sp.]MDP2128834.1 xylulose 5-phosphate 3-epimerase [Pseudohongiella sp.]
MISEQLDWAQGYGVIEHNVQTRQRMDSLLDTLEKEGICPRDQAQAMLAAADRLCNMGLWLTAHMTYVKNVHLDGRELLADDFKSTPEGHTGGALNMVPAYVGYLLANALTGRTRAWLMGQGHCVAAIDSVNILMRNLEPEQDARYTVTDEGLSRLCQDFYSYQVSPDGKPAAPLGSHVSVFTAGGVSEGGYLGFTGLQYVHMPLPGQELVTFLSDGAFEEQRGSDWTPRWWRGEDSGLVMPIMIANGRRIDQRTTMSQAGGVTWFREHLELNGFLPVDIDGRDPAAFAWAIITMARDLQEQHRQITVGDRSYPVQLPYAIAETVKGFGFPGAGTNAAHNLPLIGNPSQDDKIRQIFNKGAARLFVGTEELKRCVQVLSNHSKPQRMHEKDHWLRRLQVSLPKLPAIVYQKPGASASPMQQIDEWFCQLAELNPRHRIRIGNPDEIRSNRMNKTLDTLRHRVTDPELTVAESINGAVITALNEEAVVSAALANKQGISLAVSYEAFAVKMLGAMRQEVIFARHMRETGRAVHWLSVPIIASSHTWENGKNEISHQDPTLSEAWLGEMSDVAPVLFPFDGNSAVTVMSYLYRQRGRVAVVVSPKGTVPVMTQPEQAEQSVRDGAVVLSHDHNARVQFVGMGAYQMVSVQRAARVLREKGISCSVVAMVEPGRFRLPRDEMEAAYVHSVEHIAQLIPYVRSRLFVCHTHAEVITGVLRPLDTGARDSRFLGYRNRGGTLDVFGMLYANQQTWAHLVLNATQLLDLDEQLYLSAAQLAAVSGSGNPDDLR